LPDFCARAVSSPTSYKFTLVTMVKFLVHEKDIEQELIWRVTLTKQSHVTEWTRLQTVTVIASGSEVHVWARPQHTCNPGGVRPFTGGPQRSRT